MGTDFRSEKLGISDKKDVIILSLSKKKYELQVDLLQNSESSLTRMYEVSTKPEAPRFEAVHREIQAWAKKENCVDGVIEVYQKYLSYGYCRTYSERQNKKSNKHDFGLQRACLTFVGVVQDCTFQRLVVTDIEKTWVREKTSFGVERFRQSFVLAPLLDDVLLKMQKLAKEVPSSAMAKSFQESFEVYHQVSWVELSLRIDGSSGLPVAAGGIRGETVGEASDGRVVVDLTGSDDENENGKQGEKRGAKRAWQPSQRPDSDTSKSKKVSYISHSTTSTTANPTIRQD